MVEFVTVRDRFYVRHQIVDLEENLLTEFKVFVNILINY